MVDSTHNRTRGRQNPTRRMDRTTEIPHYGSPLRPGTDVAAVLRCAWLCCLLPIHSARIGVATALEFVGGLVRLFGVHHRLREDPAARWGGASGIILILFLVSSQI